MDKWKSPLSMRNVPQIVNTQPIAALRLISTLHLTNKRQSKVELKRQAESDSRR